ncbi:MAG: hypothetical protein DRI65_03080 [Chloroflexota bacterium]|nr:MAG: hypothetical protein DRI65_03080 [Chloroflexota bacterium]
MRGKGWIYLSGTLLFLLVCAAVLVSFGSNQFTAFVDVNLVPMTGEKVLPGQTVLVRGYEIVQIGPVDEVRVPLNARVIDGSGKYLLPGLADMHMHTRQDWDDQALWPVSPLALYLANGVTTVRDLGPTGSEITYPLQWRDEIDAGTRIGPQILASGKILFSSPLKDPAGLVRENYELGFDFLKVYSYVSGPDYGCAMKEAQDLGMYVVGHIPFAIGLESTLAGGMDEIAHVEELIYEFFNFDRHQQLSPEEWIPVIIKSVLEENDFKAETFLTDFIEKNGPAMDGISAQLLAADAPVSTTMVVDEVVVLKNFQQEEFAARSENIYFKEGYMDGYLQGDEKHLNQCRGVEEVCAAKAAIDLWILQELHEAGVILVLGTDAGTGGMGIVPGFSVHDELDILLENGFTPYEALETATVNAALVADRMVVEGDFGTVVVGNRADLLLVEGNPLEDIATLRDPLGVMADGRWYPRSVLRELIAIK